MKYRIDIDRDSGYASMNDPFFYCMFYARLVFYRKSTLSMKNILISCIKIDYLNEI